MMHDSFMPKGWHQFKCALLNEINAAETLDLCYRGAQALGHGRLIAESIARECGRGTGERDDCGSTPAATQCEPLAVEKP